MPDFGIIYYVDGVKNLYRNDVNPAVPVWKGKCSLQILSKRLSDLKAAGSVLLLPEQQCDDLKSIANGLGISVIEFNSEKILEKPYGLNQQHWFLEDSSGNDSWYGEGFNIVFEQFPNWKHAVLVQLTNLLIDANDVADCLELYAREGFEACFAEERIPGAEWTVLNSDLVRGLYRSNPEIMTMRGGLYWAVRKPLYPFKVGSYHCPRIRPSFSANLRLNSQRALYCYQTVASDDFDTPGFSYGNFLNDSGWEKAYTDYGPLQIVIEPSSFCNAACEGCPNGRLKRDRSFLSLEYFQKIIDGIEDKDIRLIFSGVGEPLLNENLSDMIKLSSDFNITIQTSLQVPFNRDFPFEAVDHIRISIDSDTQKGFERLRPGCSWANIQNFIEWGSDQKLSYEIKFPEIGLDYLRRGCSESDILPFMKKWKTVCDPVFKSNFYRWPFSLKPNKISWYQVSGEAEYCGLTTNTSSVSFEPFKRRLCRNALLSLTVLSNGIVTGCPFDAEGNCFVLGNLNDNTLLDIWKSDKASDWRKQQLNRSFTTNANCLNCHDWYRTI